MDETRTPETGSNGALEPKRRKRTGRKRTSFKKAPRPAWPVKGLWETAPAEEKARAHTVCMAILEYWLGKKTKGQVADELSVTPLRVWQLSQLALSGMMAGLLTQPRRRVGPEALDRPRGETPAGLKRRLVDLEKKLARTEDLVRVLRMAPWAASNSESAPKGGSRASSRARSSKKVTSKKGVARAPKADRAPAPGEAAHGGGAGCAG